MKLPPLKPFGPLWSPSSRVFKMKKDIPQYPMAVFKRYKSWDDFPEHFERLKKEMDEKGMLNENTTLDEICEYAGIHVLITEGDHGK
jgi:hypothetical protein